METSKRSNRARIRNKNDFLVEKDVNFVDGNNFTKIIHSTKLTETCTSQLLKYCIFKVELNQRYRMAQRTVVQLYETAETERGF